MPPIAAADSGKATHKSSSSPSSSSSANSSPTMKNSNASSNGTKLCHIVKRADFDGYGFNLHSEKSKPGQYIGKIDANSPAEAAGLKEGDRILEVNGLTIGNETHKQVVQRIKAIAWEVKLLVVRESVTTNTTSTTESNDSSSANKSSSTKSNNSTKENKTKNQQTATATAATTNNGSANNAVSVINNNNASSSPIKNNGSSTSQLNPTTPPPPFTPSPTPPLSSSSSSISSKTSPPGCSAIESANENPVGTLKLPSTAAEMRAILQSKKKYNPKSDDVNLQKKYDIIQKL